MTLKTWALFLVMETALSLSPGPAVFYVVSQAVKGFPRAVPAAAGILAANGIYFALSATSLGALVASSAGFFQLVRWVGAAYLLYLGVRALLSPASRHAPDRSALVGPDASVPSLPPERQVFTGALTLQLANPKALLLFIALLPQFIDLHRPVAPQVLILAATSMIPESFILVGYGWLAHRAVQASARLGMSGGAQRWLTWIEGAGLVACAALVLRIPSAA